MLWKRRKSKTMEKEVVGKNEEGGVRISRRNNKLEE